MQMPRCDGSSALNPGPSDIHIWILGNDTVRFTLSHRLYDY